MCSVVDIYLSIFPLAGLTSQGSDVSSVNATTSASSTQALDQNLFMTMPYSPFTNPVEGSWTPTTFDPSLVTAFGFTGAGLMSGQTLANTPSSYYFPGAPDLGGGAGIWGQDSTAVAANSLLMNSFFVNPLLDQQQQQQQMTGSDMMSLDPVIGLGQNFAGMAVNGVPPVSGVMHFSDTGVQADVNGVGPVQSVTTTLPSPTLASSGSADSSIMQTSSTQSSTPAQSSAPQPEKPKSWAAIASQPAKPRPPPPPKVQPAAPDTVNDSPPPGMGGKKSGQGSRGGGVNGAAGASHRSEGHSYGKGSSGMRSRTHGPGSIDGSGGGGRPASKSSSQSELVGKLKSENKYNPSELTVNTSNARFFVIKSYAEDDIHRSIKYSIWTSTDHGNRRLDQAYRDQKGKGGVYLFFSVNGSGHFCGMAQMVSEVDFNTVTGVWAQDKWKGSFKVKWIYVKDVPNSQLRHIRLENNENKPVTNSRDTQEVPLAKARQVIRIVHGYLHSTSIFDDFDHYEKRQEEDGKVR